MNEYDKQARDFLAETGTQFNIKYLYTGRYFHGDKEPRDVYWFLLSNERGTYSGEFGDSLSNTNRKPKRPPRPYDILACIGGQYPDSFDEFVDEYGYSTAPRSDRLKIERIYRAIKDEERGLSSIFTPDQLDKLAEIR